MAEHIWALLDGEGRVVGQEITTRNVDPIPKRDDWAGLRAVKVQRLGHLQTETLVDGEWVKNEREDRRHRRNMRITQMPPDRFMDAVEDRIIAALELAGIALSDGQKAAIKALD